MMEAIEAMQNIAVVILVTTMVFGFIACRNPASPGDKRGRNVQQ
jgi:hypothetical protein